DLLVEPHVVDLFDGTLREQLATRAPLSGVDPGDVWADDALHAAGAEDLLRILPEGYDTRILDRGANLSGGQRQRVALAPAAAGAAVTGQNVAEALLSARRRTDRGTLLVTRAPALLQEVDRVVFMRGGAVVTEGTHQDLMGYGEYREVVRR